MRDLISTKKQNVRYLFIDVETGGLCLNECWTLPWQIAFISVLNNKIEKEHNFYIKWPPGEFRISRGAQEKNHYNPDFIEREGVKPETVYPVMKKAIEEADYCCGHNIIGLDSYIVQAFCRKLGYPPINILESFLDTFAIAKGIRREILPKDKDDLFTWQYRMHHYIRKGFNKLKLEDLGKEYGIEHDYSSLHDALSDLQLNVKVFQHQQYMFNL